MSRRDSSKMATGSGDGGKSTAPVDILPQLEAYFCRKWSTNLRVPRVNGMEIDLNKLYKCVTGFGGWFKVSSMNRWPEVSRTMTFAEDCGVADHALRVLYMRFLARFEAEQMFGDDGLSSDDGGGARGASRTSRHYLASFLPPNSLSARAIEIIRNTQRESLAQLDLPSNPYVRLMRSLESGLPNDVDFGLNVCVILSSPGPHTLQLERAPQIVELLLAHVGIFDEGPASLRSLYEHSWKKFTKNRPIQFWHSNLQSTSILDLIGAPDDSTNVEVPTSYFGNHSQSLDAKNSVGQRIVQICSILRNLSFESFNQPVLAGSETMLKFLLVCVHSPHSCLQAMALDTLSNIAPTMVVDSFGPAVATILLETVWDLLCSNDKSHIIRALETLGNICSNRFNETVMEQFLDSSVLERLMELLSAKDIMMSVYLLECLYQISELGETTSQRIARLPYAVDTIVSLITIEAVSFGSSGLLGIKVLEHKPPTDSDVQSMPPPADVGMATMALSSDGSLNNMAASSQVIRQRTAPIVAGQSQQLVNSQTGSQQIKPAIRVGNGPRLSITNASTQLLSRTGASRQPSSAMEGFDQQQLAPYPHNQPAASSSATGALSGGQTALGTLARNPNGLVTGSNTAAVVLHQNDVSYATANYFDHGSTGADGGSRPISRASTVESNISSTPVSLAANSLLATPGGSAKPTPKRVRIRKPPPPPQLGPDGKPIPKPPRPPRKRNTSKSPAVGTEGAEGGRKRARSIKTDVPPNANGIPAAVDPSSGSTMTLPFGDRSASSSGGGAAPVPKLVGSSVGGVAAFAGPSLATSNSLFSASIVPANDRTKMPGTSADSTVAPDAGRRLVKVASDGDAHAESVAKSWLKLHCIIDPLYSVTLSELYTNYANYLDYGERGLLISLVVFSSIIRQTFPSCVCHTREASNTISGLKTAGMTIEGIRFLGPPIKPPITYTPAPRVINSGHAISKLNISSTGGPNAAIIPNHVITNNGQSLHSAALQVPPSVLSSSRIPTVVQQSSASQAFLPQASAGIGNHGLATAAAIASNNCNSNKSPAEIIPSFNKEYKACQNNIGITNGSVEHESKLTLANGLLGSGNGVTNGGLSSSSNKDLPLTAVIGGCPGDAPILRSRLANGPLAPPANQISPINGEEHARNCHLSVSQSQASPQFDTILSSPSGGGALSNSSSLSSATSSTGPSPLSSIGSGHPSNAPQTNGPMIPVGFLGEAQMSKSSMLPTERMIVKGGVAENHLVIAGNLLNDSIPSSPGESTSDSACSGRCSPQRPAQKNKKLPDVVSSVSDKNPSLVIVPGFVAASCRVSREDSSEFLGFEESGDILDGQNVGEKFGSGLGGLSGAAGTFVAPNGLCLSVGGGVTQTKPNNAESRDAGLAPTNAAEFNSSLQALSLSPTSGNSGMDQFSLSCSTVNGNLVGMNDFTKVGSRTPELDHPLTTGLSGNSQFSLRTSLQGSTPLPPAGNALTVPDLLRVDNSSTPLVPMQTSPIHRHSLTQRVSLKQSTESFPKKWSSGVDDSSSSLESKFDSQNRDLDLRFNEIDNGKMIDWVNPLFASARLIGRPESSVSEDCQIVPEVEIGTGSTRTWSKIRPSVITESQDIHNNYHTSEFYYHEFSNCLDSRSKTVENVSESDYGFYDPFDCISISTDPAPRNKLPLSQFGRSYSAVGALESSMLVDGDDGVSTMISMVHDRARCRNGGSTVLMRRFKYRTKCTDLEFERDSWTDATIQSDEQIAFFDQDSDFAVPDYSELAVMPTKRSHVDYANDLMVDCGKIHSELPIATSGGLTPQTMFMNRLIAEAERRLSASGHPLASSNLTKFDCLEGSSGMDKDRSFPADLVTKCSGHIINCDDVPNVFLGVHPCACLLVKSKRSPVMISSDYPEHLESVCDSAVSLPQSSLIDGIDVPSSPNIVPDFPKISIPILSTINGPGNVAPTSDGVNDVGEGGDCSSVSSQHAASVQNDLGSNSNAAYQNPQSAQPDSQLSGESLSASTSQQQVPASSMAASFCGGLQSNSLPGGHNLGAHSTLAPRSSIPEGTEHVEQHMEWTPSPGSTEEGSTTAEIEQQHGEIDGIIVNSTGLKKVVGGKSSKKSPGKASSTGNTAAATRTAQETIDLDSAISSTISEVASQALEDFRDQQNTLLIAQDNNVSLNFPASRPAPATEAPRQPPPTRLEMTLNSFDASVEATVASSSRMYADSSTGPEFDSPLGMHQSSANVNLSEQQLILSNPMGNAQIQTAQRVPTPTPDINSMSMNLNQCAANIHQLLHSSPAANLQQFQRNVQQQDLQIFNQQHNAINVQHPETQIVTENRLAMNTGSAGIINNQITRNNDGNLAPGIIVQTAASSVVRSVDNVGSQKQLLSELLSSGTPISNSPVAAESPGEPGASGKNVVTKKPRPPRTPRSNGSQTKKGATTISSANQTLQFGVRPPSLDGDSNSRDSSMGSSASHASQKTGGGPHASTFLSTTSPVSGSAALGGVKRPHGSISGGSIIAGISSAQTHAQTSLGSPVVKKATISGHMIAGSGGGHPGSSLGVGIVQTSDSGSASLAGVVAQSELIASQQILANQTGGTSSQLNVPQGASLVSAGQALPHQQQRIVATSVVAGCSSLPSGSAVVQCAPGTGSNPAAGQVVQIRILPPRPEQVKSICEWDNCKRTFWKPSQVYYHVVTDHVTGNGPQPCLWANCDRTVRLRWSLVTHINDHHCSEKNLRLAALRHYELSQCGVSNITVPRAPQSHPGYAPDAAVSAIRRHSFNHLKKELWEESEGPVTKSLRLTSCLILRNLARYSSEGRRQLRKHESALAPLVFSRMESSMALAQTLAQLSPGAPSVDTPANDNSAD